MIYAIVAVIVLILDQGLKYWTVSNIVLNTGEVPLIKGIVHLAHVRNYGAAFGIMKDSRWLLVALTAVFVIAVIYALSTERIHTKLGRWSAMMVMAGALGNGIDRLFIGYVVDMIEVEFLTFPVFNVADIFVVVFGILFCIYIVFHKEPDEIETEPTDRRTISERIKNRHEPEPESRRGGDIEMVRKASVHKPQPEPVMQPEHEAGPVRTAPQPRPEAKAFDPHDPFAEWDRTAAAQGNFRPRSAEKPAVTDDVREYIPSQPVSARAPIDSAPSADSTEFNIDDILAEFKD